MAENIEQWVRLNHIQLLISAASQCRSKSCLPRKRTVLGFCSHHDAVDLKVRYELLSQFLFLFHYAGNNAGFLPGIHDDSFERILDDHPSQNGTRRVSHPSELLPHAGLHLTTADLALQDGNPLASQS